jgi:hypothetical protein
MLSGIPVFNPIGVAPVAQGWRFAYLGKASKRIFNPEGVAALALGKLSLGLTALLESTPIRHAATILSLKPDALCRMVAPDNRYLATRFSATQSHRPSITRLTPTFPKHDLQLGQTSLRELFPTYGV